MGIGICNNCKELCLVYDNRVRVYPHPLPSPTDERIPEELRKDLDEAKICYSVGAYRACAVLARIVVQVCCINKEADKSKKLYQQIEELYESRVITEDIKSWATVIRWIGNDAAHPRSNIVDKEEADDV